MRKVVNVLIFIVFFLIGLYLFQDKGVKKFKEKEKPLTKIFIEERRIDIGNLVLDSVSIKEIPIKNIGVNPLYISDITTGCGCLDAEFKGEKILPDSVGTIVLKIKPENTGYYVQRIAVYGNLKEVPLMLSVKGLVTE